jgi:uncharacterized protein (TIGR02588 family)
MESNSAHRDDHSSGVSGHTPVLEWIASAVGLLLILFVLGFIGWQALNDPHSPPTISVEATNISPVPGGYRILFQARNAGGAAAAQVRIEGTLSGSGQEPQTSSVIIDYIPGHSTREGGLFFTQNPQAGNLVLRASGFADP